MPIVDFKTPDLKDTGPAWQGSYGISGTSWNSADASGGNNNFTDPPASGKKLVVTDMVVSVDTAMKVSFNEESIGSPLLEIYLPANGTVQLTPRQMLKLSTADKYLQVKTSVPGNISITAFYHSED